MSMRGSENAPSPRPASWLSELSGAFADLGTFLPLTAGILAIRQFDATGVLIGFGLFALAVAVFYRRPIPVQPMKVVTALVITGAITPLQAMASGLLIGAVLTVLAFAGVIGRLARMVPNSVIMGIQLGVGAQLTIIGVQHVAAEPIYGVAALALLGALFFTSYKNVSCLLVIVGAAGVSLSTGAVGLGGLQAGLHLPHFGLPTIQDFEAALLTTALPQLALTLSNAVLATAAIAADYFPVEKERMSATRLAASTGILNLGLAPFGAIPMCHGSGGLVAQYGFGARSWGAPAIFGALCLILGVAYGPQAGVVLAILPLGAVGAMLAVAGADLAISRKFLAINSSYRIVVVLTGVACVATNVAAGLFIGLVLEGIRALWVRRMGDRAI